METYIVGFDLGGTKMLAAVLDQNMELVASAKKKTKNIDGEDDLLDRIEEIIDEALASAEIARGQIAGIGIAVPGVVDAATGTVKHIPNLNLHDLDIRKGLGKRFCVPVVVENDVNAGVYGEYRFGPASSARHVIGLFVGTGIGGGIILDGKLYRGAGGGAGEIGHIIMQTDGPTTPVGIAGTLEGLASKTALAKDMVMLANAGYAPTVLQEAGTDIARIKSSVIKKAIDNEDEAVVALVDRSIEFLGIGMATCVQIFNPEVILLGGGVVEKLGKTYVEKATAAMKAHCMPALAEQVMVVEASLGDNAVPFGAAALIKVALQEGVSSE